MWVKVNNEYWQDPCFYGVGWQLSVSDLDGARLLVKRMKTSRRKMLEVIRKNVKGVKLDGEIQHVRDILPARLEPHHVHGRLIDCAESRVCWKKDTSFEYHGECRVKCVVTERPMFGTVINEDEGVGK